MNLINDLDIELSIIVPCLNEEKVIPIFTKEMNKIAHKLPRFELLFIDDGSIDSTGEEIRKAAAIFSNLNIKLIKLSRNWGHQKALWAGMSVCSGKSCVSLDIDLQDPPEIILEMVSKWKEGYDVVLGQRVDRTTDTIFKKITANIFYWVMTKFINPNFPRGVGDFRLIDRKVIDQMKLLNDSTPYWRGLVIWLGFKMALVPYKREKRAAGETKYPLMKMISFASNAIMSFSTKPLMMVNWVGLFFSFLSLIIMLIYVLQKLLNTNQFIPGWVSLVSLITFLNGINLLCIGVIGQYVGKIYEQSLDRPKFIIDKIEKF